jgi:hypothetical protein
LWDANNILLMVEITLCLNPQHNSLIRLRDKINFVCKLVIVKYFDRLTKWVWCMAWNVTDRDIQTYRQIITADKYCKLVCIKSSTITFMIIIVRPKCTEWCNYLRNIQHSKYQNMPQSYVIYKFPVFLLLK